MKLLVFGSLNIDHVYSLPHLVREGETLDSIAYQKNEGGKGLNQAIALAKAGSEVHFAGAIGKDGAFLLDFMSRFGIQTKNVRTLDVPTGHAIIQVDVKGLNSIILYGGANRSVSPAMIDEALGGFGEGDCLLLQNEISGLEHMLCAARSRGVTIILNPSPVTEELLRAPLELVDWLLLNEIEGRDLTGETEPKAILDALLGRYPACRAVLTLGEEGAVYADAARRVVQPAVKAETVDSTAAGDTFTGYFINAVLSGEPVERSLRRAAQAAAIAVSRPGAGRSIPYADEVDARMAARAVL